MAINKMNDGVGKKIVEALKMQAPEMSEDEKFMSEGSSDFENSDMMTDESESMLADNNSYNPSLSFDSDMKFDSSQIQENPHIPSNIQMKIQSQLREQSQQAQYGAGIDSQSFVDTAFQQSLVQNLRPSAFAAVPDDFEYPANVAVLKQLIGKLPAGVSKQTGAIIIKQTMEALGISMKNVIQEAQQVQDTLNSNARECQANIIEYRKQIGILEAKSQQFQRQAAIMNDIIGLFVHTGSRK